MLQAKTSRPLIGILAKLRTNEMPILNLDYSYVPTDYCVEGLRNYFEKHVKPGSFLTALLENDFQKMVQHADPINSTRLLDWAKWIHNEAPMNTTGSKAIVDAWLVMRTYGTDSKDDGRLTTIHESDSDRSSDGELGSQEAGR